jgi:hypothetical protein
MSELIKVSVAARAVVRAVVNQVVVNVSSVSGFRVLGTK